MASASPVREVITRPRGKRRRLFRKKHLAQQNLAEQEQQRRQVPSWLVSFVVHLLLLLVLAVIPLAEFASGPLTFMLGQSAGDATSEFDLAAVDSSAAEQPDMLDPAAMEPKSSTENLLKEIEVPDFDSPDPTESVTPALTLIDIPFGISKGLSGRKGSLKQSLLAKFGGTAKTEKAVDLGLKWLAEQQKSNGSWSLIGPYTDGGASENTTAATALAINAFLGAGYTHKEGKYQDALKLGIAYLVRRQDKQGFFAEREPARQQMYAQAIASICIIEAFGMTEDYSLLKPAQKAIDFAEWSQSDLRGWRYDPRVDADLSVTGWFVMALETGKMAGLAVDEEKLSSVSQYLDSIAYEDDSRYAYTTYTPPSLSMTAEGLLCRIYLGWPRTHPALLAAIHDDLLPSVPGENDPTYSVYYWYYATQVLHHVGGGPWKQWNDAMRETLPNMQEKAGKEAGSWDPSKDAFGAAGGRLYTTCLNLYCLEVYYRHLALYDLDDN